VITAEESFATVAEQAPAMIWRGDAHGKCIYLNRAQREFWGLAPEDVARFSWADTLLAEDSEKVFGPFAQGMQAHQGFECEARYRRADGEVRILRTLAQPQFNAAGAFTGMVGVNTDVTELRESEARLRLLMGEMNHRVKNLLSTVLSIAVQTGRSAQTVAAFNTSFQARVMSLAKSHDLLLRDASDSADLREILEAELRPYAPEAGGVRTLNLHGEPIRLAARNALGLALVVHELATNAAKYGAYSASGGLDVSWTYEPGEDLVTLQWREHGGPPVVQPRPPGFGSRLIAAVLKSDLSGRIESRFTPAGLHAELHFRAHAV